MREAETFRNLGTKFRRLAEQASDEETVSHLLALADEYEAQARRIEAAPGMPQAE